MKELEPKAGIDGPLAKGARFAVGSIDLPGIDEPDFNAFFRHVPGVFVATRPDFTIAAASDDMLRKTFTWREVIIGRSMFDVFPNNPCVEAFNSAGRLERLLRDVQANGTTNTMRAMRYDIQDRLGDGGAWIEKYWAFISRPVIDRNTKHVLYALTEGRDVTRIIHLALWAEQRDETKQLAPDMQRTLDRLREDAVSHASEGERVRARVAEEARVTGATPQMLLGELKALLRAPENRLYACAGEWVAEAGVYVAYHRGGCLFAPRVRYFAEGLQFPSCARCGNDVLYRLSRTFA